MHFPDFEDTSRLDEQIERTLVELAVAFITTEEVNSNADEARVALQGREHANLATVIEALDAARRPFKLRPLGFRELDHARVKERLPQMLNATLRPVGHLKVTLERMRARARSALAEELEQSEEPLAADYNEPEELEREAQAYVEKDIFQGAGTSSLGTTPLGTLSDPLLARDDVPHACAAIEDLLEHVERRFDYIRRSHGVNLGSRVEERFAHGIAEIRECLAQLQPRQPAAHVIASDVFDAVRAGFTAVDPTINDLPGAVGAAEILARIILELTDLVAATAKRDDPARHEYMSKMRTRADQVYVAREPVREEMVRPAPPGDFEDAANQAALVRPR